MSTVASQVGSILAAAAPNPTLTPSTADPEFQREQDRIEEERRPGEDKATVEDRLEAADQRAAYTKWRETLTAAGVDPDSPAVQGMLGQYETDKEKLEFLESSSGILFIQGAAQTPGMALPISDYRAAFLQAGFGETGLPVRPPTTPMDLRSHAALAQNAAGGVGPITRYNDETGWAVFGNGTLVGPDGQVIFDPASDAPGSQRWIQSIQGTWGESQVSEWRKKLVDMGYLDSSEKNVRGWNTMFTTALRNYHFARYQNGGRPIAAAGGGGGQFAGQPLFDYTEITHQTKNSVAAMLEQYYGVVPEEEEVRRWTQFVLRQAAGLQKKFRRQEVSGYTSAAYGEAEETFIDQIRQDTAGYRRDEQENTTLRDSLRNAAAAASGLG